MNSESNPSGEQPRYGKETTKALDNFQISHLRPPRPFLFALGHIKHACAAVNAEYGNLKDEMSKAIQSAALSVASGEQDEHFQVDVFQTGSGTSTNMNANEVIASLASDACNQTVHPNDHVNLGQSSNDVIPTSIHVSAALETHNQLLPSLEHLQTVIEEKASQYEGQVKTGRTHLMDAVPLTVCQELSGWAEQIYQSRQHIQSCLPGVLSLAIGGTAVGTGLNATPMFGAKVSAHLAKSLNLPFTSASNKFAAISSQDAAVRLSGALKQGAISVSKIANDIRWLNSGPVSGIADIKLATLQAGSSIMPGKVNPVIPEAVLMACAQIQGNDVTISTGAQSGNFQLNTALPLIAYNLLQSIQLLSNASTHLADKAIATMEFDVARLDEKLWRNPILITGLTDRLGYDMCSKIVAKVHEEGRSILDVAHEISGIERGELEQLLEPKKLVKQHPAEPEV